MIRRWPEIHFKSRYKGSWVRGKEYGFDVIEGMAEVIFDLGVSLLTKFSIKDDGTLNQSFKLEAISV